MKTASKLDRAIEPLERRMLMSLAASGGEFPVNSYTTSYQYDVKAAVDGDGDFVLVWASNGQDGDDSGIFARRYTAAGVPQGNEFRVNTFTTNDQREPAIAIDADGDFVIAWESYDGDGTGIIARQFNAAGVGGKEFVVNTYTTQYQEDASVAMDALGNFVVAWESEDQDGSESGVFAQRFDFAGVKQGAEFQVNNVTADDQYDAAVAMDRSGNFVIAFDSRELNEEDGSNIYMRRFNAAGVAQAQQSLVNTYTLDYQYDPSVAMDADGDFVIAWGSDYQDGSYGGIYAQRYSRSGVTRGGEMQVHVATINGQYAPCVAMNGNGDFTVAWSGRTQGPAKFDTYGRTFNAAGAPQTGEFVINTITAGQQGQPAIASDPEGDFVVAWVSYDNNYNNSDISAQRFNETADTSSPMIGGAFVNGVQVRPYSTHEISLQHIVVSFSKDMSTGGASSVTDPSNWLLTRNGDDITTNVTEIAYQFNPATNRYEATLELSAPLTSGNFQLRARDSLRDAAGHKLDGDLTGSPGGSTAFSFSVEQLRKSPELHANVFTTLKQQVPAIASDRNGNYVVVWESEGQDGSGLGVFARLYNAKGTPVSAEIPVNVFTAGTQGRPTVAMDADGDFVVAWNSQNQTGLLADLGYGIFGRRFNAAGVPQGGEFHVNTFTTNAQGTPAVAMDDSGSFVVAWHSYLSGLDANIVARRYASNGQPMTGEIAVNTYTPDYQNYPSVAMDKDGDFVVAWSSLDEDAPGAYGIFARRFAASGTPQGGAFLVNQFTANNQGGSSVAMDADGNFLIAWSSFTQDGDGQGIYSRRFTAAGVTQGPDLQVNTTATSHQIFASVAMSPDGQSVITWSSLNQDGSSYGVYARRYDAAGAPRGGEIPVNSVTANSQDHSAAAMDSRGNFVVAWDSVQEGSGTQTLGVFLKKMSIDATPTVTALQRDPEPVNSGGMLQLNATGLVGDTPITRVSFYRESNGVLGLQVGAEGDVLVGIDPLPTTVGTANVSTAGLPNGTYTYYAQATDDAGLVGAPAIATSTVVGGPPAVSSSEFAFETAPQRLVFRFDQDVSGSLSLADFVVQKIGGPTATPDALSYDPATNTATLTFNAPLADGMYQATVQAAGVTNSGGTPMAFNHVLPFFFFGGDGNHDGKVDVGDLGILAVNWQQSGHTFSEGDFNYDGSVNIGDLGILATNWQKQLPAPSAPAKSPTLSRQRVMEEIFNLAPQIRPTLS